MAKRRSRQPSEDWVMTTLREVKDDLAEVKENVDHVETDVRDIKKDLHNIFLMLGATNTRESVPDRLTHAEGKIKSLLAGHARNARTLNRLMWGLIAVLVSMILGMSGVIYSNLTTRSAPTSSYIKAAK